MRLKMLLVSLLYLQMIGTACAAVFRASAVVVDITPNDPQWLGGYAARQSDGVNDRLYHRIAVLDDGKTAVFFISTIQQ
jgi:hypothetical protein